MKKFIRLIALIMLVTIPFTLTACDNHEHEFDDEWSFNSDKHWHACTVKDDCDEKSDREDHDFEVVLNEDGKLVNSCKVCGYTNEKVSTAPEHEHEFAETYSHSEDYHWHECTVEGCFETDKSDEHQYGNPETTYADQKLTITYTCVDCAYVKTEVETVDSTVDSNVEWDNIFESFKLTNFSMYVYIGGKDSPEWINECVVTEKGVYYHLGNSTEFYVVKNNDGGFDGYVRDNSGDEFALMDEEMRESYFNNATRETVIQVNFAENFDKFEYNAETGCYFAEEKIAATYYTSDGEIGGTLYCYNSEVRVVDGKIVSIACDYDVDYDDGNPNHALIYFNIGMSEVKIPQSVIDDAQ